MFGISHGRERDSSILSCTIAKEIRKLLGMLTSSVLDILTKCDRRELYWKWSVRLNRLHFASARSGRPSFANVRRASCIQWRPTASK